MSGLKNLFLFNLKLLLFRTTREDFDSITSKHLLFGLVVTWIVGVGRWWDDPGAKLLQHLGLGSVCYIFVLAAIVWLIVLPLKARNWSYKHVLTFLSLTSLPAVLYAIPVERYFTVETSRTMNLSFLAVVALWRVILLFFYLGRHAGLNVFSNLVVGLLPLTVIVTSLFVLNLHRVVFDVMGGFREASPHDGEFSLLFLLTMLSYVAVIPMIVSYILLVVLTRWTSTKPDDGV